MSVKKGNLTLQIMNKDKEIFNLLREVAQKTKNGLKEGFICYAVGGFVRDTVKYC